MEPDRWRQAKELFRAAQDLPISEREAFLTKECGDADLRDEVLRLLRLHDEPSEFLKTPIGPSRDAPENDPLIGRRLGGFELLRRLGAGGMGAVYEARQDHPQRRAAVKVLRPGFATRGALRRLEFEAEVLARLHHPGIAHVYAAGTFEAGGGVQPWFAMELIDGPPLHDYTRDHPLSIRRKLELLLLICDAVQHAHQRGVVHRDLKPANILVVDRSPTPDNFHSARGTDAPSPGAFPKILDFGVARLVDADVQATMHTAVGEFVGTLSYMSPEQLAGDPAELDARCDVYALGVIGYELLAGRLPHAPRSSAIAEIVRAIEQEEPKRLGLIDPALRGDVETILAKALEKDRARRYQSAAELAADIRRCLNDEPVLARPATAAYQLSRFARRNKPLVGGVLATIVALAGGVVASAWQARQARLEAARSKYEADKALAINNFITNDFVMKLLAAGHSREGEERLPAAELADQAAANVASMFAGQPLAEAAVRNEVGTIFYNLGAFEKAAGQFRLALEGWESQLGPDHEDTLKAVNNLGQTMVNLGRFDEAETLYRRALDGRLRALGEDDHFTLTSMNNLANLLRFQGRLDEAEAMFRRTLAGQQRVQGPTHKHTLITMANLGALLVARGRVDEALGLHRQAYVTSRQTLGVDHPTTLGAGGRLGQTLLRAGELTEAETLLMEVLAASERTLGADHSETIRARRAVAKTLKAGGRIEEAERQLRRALDDAGSRTDRLEGLLKEIQEDLDELVRPASTTTAGP